MNVDSFEALADGLYEAAVIPELWPGVLERMSGQARAWGGVLIHRGDRPSERAIRWTSTENSRRIAEDLIAAGMLDNDWLRRYAAGGHLGFVEDRTVFGGEDGSQSDIHANFLRPRGIGWACGAVLLVPNGDSMVFGFERLIGEDPFEESVVANLDRLRPHIARAAMVAGRLGLERARTAVETMSALGVPAAVLDIRARLRLHNADFESLSGVIAQRAHGRIALAHPEADRLMNEALEQIGRGGGQRGTVRSIPVPATDDRPAAVAHLLPVARQANDVFSGADAILVVTLATAHRHLDPSIVAGLYDLTAAEARIARALVSGKSIEDMAADSGTSRETIRTHVKRVMAKTGTRRQSEVAAMLAPLVSLRAG